MLTRLAASFRATNYDMKGLFRTILNSETYQRQIRLGDSTDEHLHFAAAYPTRLPADALWESLVGALADGRPAGRPCRRWPARSASAGPGGRVQAEFEFDPSLKADEVEGSIPAGAAADEQPDHQPAKIQAGGNNLLGRILTAYPNDDDALGIVYLRALARKPTSSEITKCHELHRQKVGNRAEAFEDILWALINSTEFQTKR